jgi:hypothetical protein
MHMAQKASRDRRVQEAHAAEAARLAEQDFQETLARLDREYGTEK